MRTTKLSKGLGVFSLVLGAAELFMTRPLARFLGMEDKIGLLRFYGVREIAAGIAILAQPNNATWLWARVAGDAIDLATLGAVFAKRDDKRKSIAFATANVLGVTALDVVAGRALA
jgi:hypothetical protein